MVRWREGTKGMMRSRFAAVRVRAAHRGSRGIREPEWLLVEWPSDEKEPSRYWLSTLPEEVKLEELVRLAKIRWRIERDFQELKDELGLDHMKAEAGGAFTIMVLYVLPPMLSLSPSALGFDDPPAPVAFLVPARLPQDFQPRGSQASRAPQPGFDSYHEMASGTHPGNHPASLPLVRARRGRMML